MLPSRKMLAAALATALLSVNAAAQPRPQDTEKPGSDVPSTESRGQRGEKLGERLSRDKGVMQPPSGQDTGMVVRPPETPNKMPVIPPPGTQDKSPGADPK
jgi:hypothetical protein